MKKIALAHDHLFQIGGAERVLAVLAKLHEGAPIYTLIDDKKLSKKLLPNSNIISSRLQRIPWPNRLFRYLLLLMPKTWEETHIEGFDIIFSSSSGLVKGLSKDKESTHISYCHSPTRYLWDDKEEYIGNLPEGRFLKLFLPKILERLQIWDYDMAQKIDYFIANSNYVAAKIDRFYDRPSHVIYPPINVADFHISDSTEDYYLIVSRLRPYKRVDIAVKAFNNLKLPLKIIGGGQEMSKLKRMAHSNIEFLGEVADKERNSYLSHCKAFLYPQVEDFGITALEAMASGRPVIALAKGGALETVVDGLSGTFFDDQTWESLAHTILRFDENSYNPYKIREYSRNFDETVFKERIMNFIAEL